MRTAKDLLHDIRHTKRHGVMSEYQAWLDDVIEYLESQVANTAAVKDPTIETQMELDIPKPGQNPGRVHFYQFELLED